jgi:hypothetical protein
MTAITFFTDEFRRSHLREPRGTACWAFTYRATTDFKWSEPVWITPACTYGAAKKQMRDKIKALVPAEYDGDVYVEACP